MDILDISVVICCCAPSAERISGQALRMGLVERADIPVELPDPEDEPSGRDLPAEVAALGKMHEHRVFGTPHVRRKQTVDEHEPGTETQALIDGWSGGKRRGATDTLAFTWADDHINSTILEENNVAPLEATMS